MQGLTTGKVAKHAGVNTETLRYYEREGLIAIPPRTASGYRVYPAATVTHVRFIRRAKTLGFTLREIRELLSLRVDPDGSSGAVKARAESKIADIKAKIDTLTRMKETLISMTSACDGCAPVSVCPILDALDASGQEDGRDDHTTQPEEN